MTDEPAVSARTAPPPLPGSIEPTTANLVDALLKSPRRLAETVADGRRLGGPILLMLGCALLCHAVFGFALGLFGGLAVAGMDAVKAPLVAGCALALCLPSLYVFANVGGAPLALSQVLLLGASCLAMVGLLLVGLAPVLWLFAVSTDSAPFVVVLALLVWVIALIFALRYVAKLGSVPILQRQAGMKLWFAVLVLVTLQMVTCMRPMLAKPPTGWWTGGKQFFLAHFGSVLDGK